MPSDATLHFEFSPPRDFIDSLRVHFRLWLMNRNARKAARTRQRLLDALDTQMLDDIGAADHVAVNGLVELASYHPHAVLAGAWCTARRR